MTATLTIDRNWPPGIGPGTPLLGLPLLRRQILAAERAGFERIFVEPVQGRDLSPLLAGTRARLLEADVERGAALSARTLPSIDWLRSLREARPLPANGAFEIGSAENLQRAERWLLDGLVKENEGFMSRHVERKISLAISRRLAWTRVTPNAMTLISVGVGLVGAAFFLSPRREMQFLGALLFLAHSILDGCDGELARLKFQSSRLGGVLDFWGDNVVHSAIFGAIAISWWHLSGQPAPLLFGAAAIAGTFLSASFVYVQTMRERRDGPLFTSVSRAADSRIARLADLLARRDFIYLVVILAAFGKAHWFLIFAAFGAPIYFLVLVGLALGSRHPGRSYT